MQIEVSFDVWKALTAHRATEHESYDDVLKRLLSLEKGSPSTGNIEAAEKRSALYRGVIFPHGTKFRASYKGTTYEAGINNGEWVDRVTGERRNSPSEAAHAITKTSVNGWQFWSAQFPGESKWSRLSELR